MSLDILSIPFHSFLNIEKHDGDDFIFEAKQRPEYLNHLSTIHACVQLALAEASSGEFLQQEFSEQKNEVIPVIRKTEAKYNRPATGTLYSRASFLSSDRDAVLEDLLSKGRCITRIKVEVFDADNTRVLTAVFDWFLKMK